MKVLIYLFIISFLQSHSIDNTFKNENLPKSSSFESRNNPFIALALSAVLPGAGQIYNKNYKRGIAYLAIELINISKRQKYLDRGDDYVLEYKNFANNHWHFDKWIRDISIYADETNPVNSVMLDPNNNFFYPWNDSHHIEFYLDGFLRRTNNSSGDDWFENVYSSVCSEAILNNQECLTNEFNDAEVNKDHDFYEGISKYDLFFAGWDDTRDGECNQETINEYGSCSYVLLTNNTENAYTDNKRYYQYELRDKANKNYDIAENALTFIFINHAVSMLDAFIVNLAGNNSDFNYMTKPIYDDKINLNGLEFSIQW